MYAKNTKTVEKWSEFVYLSFVKMSVPSITIAYPLWSYALYFTTDLGAESFHMPFSFWYIYYFTQKIHS